MGQRRKTSADSVPSEQLLTFLGWFILTASFLELWASWAVDHTFSSLFALTLLGGLWLVARSSRLFGFSDSTLELYSRQISHTAASARHHHRATVPPRRRGRFAGTEFSVVMLVILAAELPLLFGGAVLRYFPLASQHLAAFLLPPLLILVYGLIGGERRITFLSLGCLYVLLLLSTAQGFALLCMVVLTLPLAYFSYRREDWPLLFWVAIGSYAEVARASATAVTAGGLNSWLSQGDGSAVPAIVIWFCVIFLSGIFSLPFIWRERQITERQRVRAILFSNGAFFLVLPLLLADARNAVSWLIGGTILAFLFASFGYLAWAYRGRHSYAKYYFLLVLFLFSLFALISSDRNSLTLLWLLLSVAVVAVGFAAQSYTARMAGLVLAAGGVANFVLATILPDWISQVPTRGSDVGVGALIILYFGLLIAWYGQAKGRLTEKSQLPLIIQALVTVGFGILAGLMQLHFAPIWQCALFIWSGTLLLLWGLQQGYAFTQALGIATIALSLLYLLLSSDASASGSLRLGLFSLTVILLLAGYFASQSAAFRNQSKLFPWKR